MRAFDQGLTDSYAIYDGTVTSRGLTMGWCLPRSQFLSYGMPRAPLSIRYALDDQRNDARRHECPGPHEVEIEPGALEYHYAELLVD
jgi:hypothetical protein